MYFSLSFGYSLVAPDCVQAVLSLCAVTRLPCVLCAPVFLSARPFIHPSIPVANKQRSSIPAVPPVKASVLWRAAHIVVSDKASLSVE